ncbi:hypothetical protein CRI94_17290 [Longibacter salinarum]|uniref:3-oxoacyl-ACP synthase n=2 Tax=Longibacter salinarum TaxID=1850348 RepID=A0A2A8CTI8_9BACT|nr:hypothetical protein CRI94_17290 [Longibacter salinarum]
MRKEDTLSAKTVDLSPTKKRPSQHGERSERKTTDNKSEFVVPESLEIDPGWVKIAEQMAASAEKKRITIRLDQDVVDFFKAQGQGYQTRINEVLKTYVLVQRMKESTPQSEESLST